MQDVFSCTAIADTTGMIQERYGYNAFGLSGVMTATFTARSTSSYYWETRYDNYRFDAESNFYQVRYRYLHPTLGRWLTRDPIADVGFRFLTPRIVNPLNEDMSIGHNLLGNVSLRETPLKEEQYLYCFKFNNPINNYDNLGLAVCTTAEKNTCIYTCKIKYPGAISSQDCHVWQIRIPKICKIRIISCDCQCQCNFVLRQTPYPGDPKMDKCYWECPGFGHYSAVVPKGAPCKTDTTDCAALKKAIK